MDEGAVTLLQGYNQAIAHPQGGLLSGLGAASSSIGAQMVEGQQKQDVANTTAASNVALENLRHQKAIELQNLKAQSDSALQDRRFQFEYPFKTADVDINKGKLGVAQGQLGVAQGQLGVAQGQLGVNQSKAVSESTSRAAHTKNEEDQLHRQQEADKATKKYHEDMVANAQTKIDDKYMMDMNGLNPGDTIKLADGSWYNTKTKTTTGRDIAMSQALHKDVSNFNDALNKWNDGKAKYISTVNPHYNNLTPEVINSLSNQYEGISPKPPLPAKVQEVIGKANDQIANAKAALSGTALEETITAVKRKFREYVGLDLPVEVAPPTANPVKSVAPKEPTKDNGMPLTYQQPQSNTGLLGAFA